MVLAVGIRPRDETIARFREAFDNVAVVGDAQKGGRIAAAIRQGFEAAYIFAK